MEANGAKLLPATPFLPFRLSVYTSAPGPYVGMVHVLASLRQKYLEIGGKIAYDTKAKQLIMDDKGKVVGVRAIGPGGVVDYMANAVVIAAGGYAANKGLLQQNIDPSAGGMMVRGRTWATGDGQMMAQEAGASLIGMTGLTSLHIAAVHPKEPAPGNPFHAVPYCVAINADGNRYIDESKGYVANGKAAMKQPKQTVSLIYDEEIRKIPAVQTSIGIFERLKLPPVEADTLEGLAGKIGVPPAALVATVKAFNEQVKDGKALGANPAKATLAYKVEKAKFYAFTPLVPGITLSFGGIMIDPSGRAMEADGRVIPGLFAAGEGAGALYYDDYVGGGSLVNCLTMGRVAGAGAAKLKG
jgi:succinate dehydrogenase/fumarate reductase flavoprotein subunit